MFALGEDVLAVIQESAFSKTSLLKEPLDLLSNAQRQTFELKSVQGFLQGQFGLTQQALDRVLPSHLGLAAHEFQQVGAALLSSS